MPFHLFSTSLLFICVGVRDDDVYLLVVFVPADHLPRNQNDFFSRCLTPPQDDTSRQNYARGLKWTKMSDVFTEINTMSYQEVGVLWIHSYCDSLDMFSLIINILYIVRTLTTRSVQS